MDYASLDLTGQDFSNGNYKGKDFTQVRILYFIEHNSMSSSSIGEYTLTYIDASGYCERNQFC